MAGIINGVSQRSVLEPVLFKTVINKLQKELSSKTAIFCDTKLIYKTNGKQNKSPKAKLKAEDNCDMPLKNFMLINDQLIKTVEWNLVLVSW